MKTFQIACALVLLICGFAKADDVATFEHQEAKKAFAAIKTPVGETAQAIGRYGLGCIAGAQKIPPEGNGWQAMRLSRNRFWGHPVLIAYIEKFAKDVKRLDYLPGLLVGDMSQPIGGPLLGGHASHQLGLDVDIWYTISPERTLSTDERERLAADNVVDQKTLTVAPARWTASHVKLLRRAASYPEVARIFVHPAVKKALCEAAGPDDRAWLQKIRPWYHHDDHFHIRLNCPPGNPACVPQVEAPAGDGCGQDLDDWFKKLRAPPLPPDHRPPPGPPPKPMLVADLPRECQTLLMQAQNAARQKNAWTPN